MTKELFAAFVLGHTLGLAIGATGMYFLMRVMRKAILESPPMTLTLAEVREWVENNNKIKELNLVTRNCLDKLAGSGTIQPQGS